MNEYCPGVRRVCVSPEKCCLSGTVCCVPTSLYSLTNEQPDKRLVIEHDIRFSVINLWYFWFAVVFFVTTCSGVCAFWRRQRRMLLQAAERSASMRLQIGHRVQLSPTMSHQPLGRQQRSGREPSAADPCVSYFATVIPVSYLDDESGMSSSQFPDPPLYSEVASGKDEFTCNDDVPPSYAEASRYTHSAYAAAAPADDVDTRCHGNGDNDRPSARCNDNDAEHVG